MSLGESDYLSGVELIEGEVQTGPADLGRVPDAAVLLTDRGGESPERQTWFYDLSVCAKAIVSCPNSHICEGGLPHELVSLNKYR